MNAKDRQFQRERMRNLIDAVTETLLSASDEEVLDDIREEGHDPAQVAQEAKSVYLAALQLRNRERLRAARQNLEKTRGKVAKQSSRAVLPEDPEEQRLLLARLLGRPDLPREVTMAFRERSASLSDDEVRSILQDLAELGLVNDSGHE